MPLSTELTQWRKQRRVELLAQRSAISPDQHHNWNEAITAHLLAGFPTFGQRVVSFYWPFKAEVDPRFALHQWRRTGARAALPLVLRRDAPLEFRHWWPGVRTSAGVFGLPQPVDTDILLPDVCLIPPVGFDAMGYRLGYGGGYFDRTLGALTPQPLKIGLAFGCSRIDSIRPQPHDIALDFIVTQDGIHHAGASGLELIADLARVQRLAGAILQARGPSTPG